MDNEKILSLFKKFAGSQLEIHGLILIPIKVEPSFKKRDVINMYFDLKNPNDVCYITTSVQDFIYDETEQFQEFINAKIDVFFTPNVKLGLHLNSEVLSEIKKIFNSVKVIEFDLNDTKTTDIYGKGIRQDYQIFIKSIGVSSSYYDDESFFLYNDVKGLRATLNGKPYDLKDAIQLYLEVFLSNKETYYESEKYYLKVDSLFSKHPLVSSDIASYYDTRFIP